MKRWACCLFLCLMASSASALAAGLSDEELDELVRRSYQYVAMYNVNNKFAMAQGGWNTCQAETQLKDHSSRDIARPNNDTLHTTCMLDLRDDAVILNVPALDSDYASLMVTGYDHYVNVPLSSRKGDFAEPTKILFYTQRTSNYRGDGIEGVDHVIEATSDYVAALFRVMPHATDTERFGRIVEQTQSIKPVSLRAYRGRSPWPRTDVKYPSVGATDDAVFTSNLFEVMQFVFNHLSFDPNNEVDQAVLALYAPLGVAPGQRFDKNKVAAVDVCRFGAAVERVRTFWLSKLGDSEVARSMRPRLFRPKEAADLDAVLAASIIGPMGLPQEEAVYQQVATTDGLRMNALVDYVVRMSIDELPPAGAFWSLTLYDLNEGFFIPNDRKKYSVGQNAGMKLGEDGGLEVYISAKQPPGVPEENWLPIERNNLDLSLHVRIYAPDLQALDSWAPPKAERIDAQL